MRGRRGRGDVRALAPGQRHAAGQRSLGLTKGTVNLSLWTPVGPQDVVRGAGVNPKILGSHRSALAQVDSTPEECLARELREEFNVEAEIGPFITSTQFVGAQLGQSVGDQDQRVNSSNWISHWVS